MEKSFMVISDEFEDLKIDIAVRDPSNGSFGVFQPTGVKNWQEMHTVQENQELT